ncbi:hypothetical protein [Nannocystis pusilla]|uniref:Uncharacterized protein n=1 Tax=Nannocystis pusilla TaxID=889268 RepID=A0ABS7TSG3_9BACT|nr:hypothetical protein [Nannocystis pusilla]MBZ5711092.1 hypothetical protein [Nannocystis pusilla]
MLIADVAAAAEETVHAVAACAVESTGADEKPLECEATVCVAAEPGHYLDDPSIVTELYWGSGNGCGAPYVAETSGDLATKICADMHAQGVDGRVRCALYARQRPRP